jgi:hypothetical protein
MDSPLGVAVAAGETEKRRIDVLMRSFPRQVLSQADIRGAVTILSTERALYLSRRGVVALEPPPLSIFPRPRHSIGTP